MSLKQTEALVIKSYGLSEADRIVVFFTREFGSVRGVAKGAKRLQSRFGSSLEPFSTVNLSYFQKEERELVSIQTVEIVQSRFGIASDPAFLETFAHLGDLLIEFAPPHDADDRLYRMITACMASVENPEGLPVIKLYFELWLLRLSGYLPDWSKCELCGSAPLGAGTAYVVAGLHLRCGNCRTRSVIEEVDPEAFDLFYRIQREPPHTFVTTSVGKTDSLDLISSVMQKLIAQVLGREVAGSKSLR